MRGLGMLAVLVLLSGCVSVEKMIEHASKSKRSWCVYFAGGMGVGEVRASGSGVEAADDGTASSTCDNKGGSVNMNNVGMGQAGGVVVAPGTVILPVQPRVYRQMAPPLEDVTPQVQPAPQSQRSVPPPPPSR